MKTHQDFLSLFRSNQKSFVIRKSIATARRAKDGKLDAKYSSVNGALTEKHIENHLAGKQCIVARPELEDGTCLWAMIDHDGIYRDSAAKLQLIDEIEKRKLPLTAFHSKSGGLHNTAFFRNPIAKENAQALLQKWATELGDPQAEIYPKNVSPGKIPYGIALPFFGEAENFGKFTPTWADSWLNGSVSPTAEPKAEVKDKVSLKDTFPIPFGEHYYMLVRYGGLYVAMGLSMREVEHRLTKTCEKRCVGYLISPPAPPDRDYHVMCRTIAESEYKLYAASDKQKKTELPKIEFNPQPTETAIVTDEEGAVRRLEAFFTKYLVLPPGIALALSLWTIGTHLYDVFDSFPYLAITAVAMRCGKSRVMDLLWHVCRMASYAANISPAALFRIVDAFHPTILLDEAEGLKNPKSETAQVMVGLLNAGHTKKAHVLRAVPASGGNSKVTVEQLSLYCPKAFTAIGKLPLTLVDRSIAVKMQRRRTDQSIARYLSRKATKEGLERLAEIKATVEKNCAAIQKEYEEVEDYDQLVDREADNWSSLLAICQVICPSRMKELQVTAINNGDEKEKANVDTSEAMLLIADLQDILEKLLTKKQLELFKDSDAPGFSSKTLLEELWKIRESPWSDEHSGHHLTAWKLSSLLRPFEVYVHKIWEGEKKMRDGKWEQIRFQGYRVADLQRATGLYAPKLRTSGHTVENKGVKDEKTPDIER